MLGTYRTVFRTPGTAAFCSAAFVMRMPIAMYPIALVLLISTRTGEYGFAGLLTGVYVAVNGLGNPWLARLIDRYGQGRFLVPCSAVHLVGLIGLIALVEADVPQVWLIAPTAVVALGFLPVGSMVRARWSYVLDSESQLSTAFSVESTLDEVVFTVGPLFATVVAIQLDPVLVFIIGGVLNATGSLLLRRQRISEPPRAPSGEPAHRSALRYRGVVLLLVASVGMGCVFASTEIVVIAFCGERGLTSASGAIVACFAFGSGVAGFVYGSRRRSGSVLSRFVRQSAIFAFLPFLFLLAVNVAILPVLVFVVGTGIAPTLINAFGLVGELVPARVVTEGLAWLGSGLSVGYGVASTLVGQLTDAHGARSAFSVTIVSALLVGLVALILVRRTRPVGPVGLAAGPVRASS